eukprot:TRINITY_DN8633_c0_g1_i1.p1 TRINITY_DN8633_c0_g1~~TRINITY_DN8633_c0_g1_i1.p1  ORF type:complete len:123 (-),score=30.10 TRINITY_DN8633_c0_g1_i1:103-471(-)
MSNPQQILIELQQRYTESQMQYNQLLQYTQLNERERLRGKASLQYLKALEEDVHCFKTVGRMFMQTTRDEAVGEMNGVIGKLEETIEQQKIRSKNLKKKVMDNEKNLEEYALQAMASLNLNK